MRMRREWMSSERWVEVKVRMAPREEEDVEIDVMSGCFDGGVVR